VCGEELRITAFPKADIVTGKRARYADRNFIVDG
jgi:hypothetical protein